MEKGLRYIESDLSKVFYDVVYNAASKLMVTKDSSVFRVYSIDKVLTLYSFKLVDFINENCVNNNQIVLTYDNYKKFKEFLLRFSSDSSLDNLLNVVYPMKEEVKKYVNKLIDKKLSLVIFNEEKNDLDLKEEIRSSKKYKELLVRELFDQYLLLLLYSNVCCKVGFDCLNEYLKSSSNVSYVECLKGDINNYLRINFNEKVNYYLYYLSSSSLIGIYLATVFNIYYFLRLVDLVNDLKLSSLLLKMFKEYGSSLDYIDDFVFNNYNRYIDVLDLFCNLENLKDKVGKNFKKVYSKLIDCDLDYKEVLMKENGYSDILKEIEYGVMFSRPDIFVYKDNIDLLAEMLKNNVFNKLDDYRIVYEVLAQVYDDFLNLNVIKKEVVVIERVSLEVSQFKYILNCCLKFQLKVFSSIVLYILLVVLKNLNNKEVNDE